MATYISASDGSLQPAFLTVMGILLLLSITSVALRLYCRVFLVHKVGADDYLIMSGLMVTIGMAVMNVFHISYGTGLVTPFSSILSLLLIGSVATSRTFHS